MTKFDPSQKVLVSRSVPSLFIIKISYLNRVEAPLSGTLQENFTLAPFMVVTIGAIWFGIYAARIDELSENSLQPYLFKTLYLN